MCLNMFHFFTDSVVADLNVFLGLFSSFDPFVIDGHVLFYHIISNVLKINSNFRHLSSYYHYNGVMGQNLKFILLFLTFYLFLSLHYLIKHTLIFGVFCFHSFIFHSSFLIFRALFCLC